jgi:hypothetical protein
MIRENLDPLLKQSAEFDEKVVNALKSTPIQLTQQSIRASVSHILCSVAIEHGESVKILLSTGNCTSAIGLIRLQYEAVVRAIWVYYTATDTAVEKLSTDLTRESAQRGQNLPMLSEMLEKMDGRAPKAALEPLLEFKEYSWKPLSSFIHGGIHAIDRHSRGYPFKLIEQSLKGSNGLNGIVGYFLTIISGNQQKVKEFYDYFTEFKDCLPYKKRENS